MFRIHREFQDTPQKRDWQNSPVLRPRARRASVSAGEKADFQLLCRYIHRCCQRNQFFLPAAVVHALGAIRPRTDLPRGPRRGRHSVNTGAAACRVFFLFVFARFPPPLYIPCFFTPVFLPMFLLPTPGNRLSFSVAGLMNSD